MFKKYLNLTMTIFCVSAVMSMSATSSAFGAVPIFSSTDIIEEADFQQIEISPINSQVGSGASTIDNSIKSTLNTPNMSTTMPQALPVATYSYGSSQETPKIAVPLSKIAATDTPVAATKTGVNLSPAVDTSQSAPIPGGQYSEIQNTNFKNAIQNLDGAQVGIREILVDYNSKYSDAKSRYDLAKEECRTLKKQIKAEEKKIKDIEKAKKTISSNIAE